MKGIYIVCLLALGLSACSSESSQEGESGTAQENGTDEGPGIAFFHGSWEAALKKAKTENKLIFLDAYADWCGPCKRMSANEFPNEALGKYFNDNFINFKMDMEKGVGPSLATKFRLTSYPTLYFLNCQGKLVSAIIGYHTADELLTLGRKIREQFEPTCGEPAV